MTKIAFNEIKLEDEDIDEAVKVLRSGKLTQGEYVQLFEEQIETKLASKNAILVNSGTSALHLALLALGVKYGDTVAVPSFTFIGSVNAIHFTGARPIFIDIDEKDFCISLQDLSKRLLKSTKAVMPIHLYGGTTNMQLLKEFLDTKGIPMVEDAAQAIGASYKSQYLGTIGELGCFSLYATKNITSIEGGIVVSDNDQLAERVRLYRNQGMRRTYEYMDYGLNNRMTEVQAAIGMKQFARLDKINRRRREIASLYMEMIDNDRIQLPQPQSETFHVYHQFVLRVPREKRGDFIAYMTKNNVETRIIYETPIHMSGIYKTEDALPATEKIIKEIVALPIHHHLSNDQIWHIIDLINKWR